MPTLAIRHTVISIVTVCLILISNQANAQTNEATNAQRIQTLGVVNGQPITRQEVSQQCIRRFGEEVLESLVNKMLVFEECQRRNLVITEKDVNDSLISDAAKLGWTAERYIKVQCDRRGISEDRLKRDIMWSELALRRLAESQTQVSPEEIRKRLEFEFGETVSCRQLVVASKQQATELRQQAAADPASFERICKQHSVDTNSASQGGILPAIHQNSGFPQFENMAFSLKPGELSPIFEVQGQFVVLKCIRRNPAKKLREDELAATEERIETELSRGKLREAAVNIFEEMQKNAEIVNVMNNKDLRRQYPGVAALVNKKPITLKQVSEECITQFGKPMLGMLIRNKLLDQALQSSGQQLSEQETQQAIDAEIRLAAQLSGFEYKGEPQVEEFLKYVTGEKNNKIEFFIEDNIWPTVAKKKLVEGRVKVTEEDIEKSFEANYGPRVEVRAMMFRDHRQATKIWKMATDNPTEAFFGKLASQYSYEPVSKNNHGHIQPVQRYSGSPTLEEEAFSLQKDEISKVIQVGDYWVILYCRGRTTPKVTNVADVRDYIIKDVRQRKTVLEMGKLQEQLFSDAQIDNYLTGKSQPGRELIKAAQKSKNLK